MTSPHPRSFFIVCAILVSFLGFHISASASTAAPATSGENLKYLSGTGADTTVEWDFFCTAGRRSGEWTKIRVPSCWEQEGFGTYFYGAWKRGRVVDNADAPAEQGKYRTTFTVPAAWKGTAVRIVFGGAFTDTAVFINGKSAGPVHQGGFYQFEHDISALLNYGDDAKNTLEVTVSKESANASVNKAERRGDFWTFGGIFRPVWLESRPADHIERVAIDARADGTFTAEVFRAGGVNHGEIKFGGTASVQIYDSKNTPVGKPVSVRFEKGENKTTIRTQIPSPLSWTAETPNLYRAEFSYGADISSGNTQHIYTQRFGFRAIEVRPGDGLYLNGVKIVLRGVDRHSFRPETGRTLTREQCYADVRLIQEMNMNAVRMSHYPPDAAFLEACDELGLYVLDELTGWQGEYDTPTGARLIGELIRRDVNHPSILFWDNGNEGGWNTENDGEFAKWDPQHRNVLHPWASHDNINTKHYPKYDALLKLCAGKEIFMPTEFMHALYDGGGGAGFSDYWKKMSASPLCAGGFIWVFADEGLMRTDEFNRIDNCGNLAPDGLVGPHHEREGSFYTVKEIWSPVTLAKSPAKNGVLPADWNGVIELQNNYAFTNLNQCKFEWYILPVKNGPATQAEIMSSTATLIKTKNIDIALAPYAKGAFKFGTPATLPEDSIVYLRAIDPNNREIWTWSWYTPASSEKSASNGIKPQLLPEGPQTLVKRGPLTMRFDRYTGMLISVALNGKMLPISAGPTLTAFIRDNRRFTNLTPPLNDMKVNSGVIRANVSSRVEKDGTVIVQALYPDPTDPAKVALKADVKPEKKEALKAAEKEKTSGNAKKPASKKSGDKSKDEKKKSESTSASKESAGDPAIPASTLLKIVWTIPPGDAPVRLDYEYYFEGKADLLGVSFEVPERAALAKSWLGRGPYRVYRNRMEGGVLGVHSQNYNDPLPGQTYATEPEFKGYFRDWRWLQLTTTGGRITFENKGETPFIGLWRPRDGVPMMLDLPDTSLTFLDVIPPQASKFDNCDNTGPSSATPKATGKRTGSVTFSFAE